MRRARIAAVRGPCRPSRGRTRLERRSSGSRAQGGALRPGRRYGLGAEERQPSRPAARRTKVDHDHPQRSCPVCRRVRSGSGAGPASRPRRPRSRLMWRCVHSCAARSDRASAHFRVRADRRRPGRRIHPCLWSSSKGQRGLVAAAHGVAQGGAKAGAQREPGELGGAQREPRVGRRTAPCASSRSSRPRRTRTCSRSHTEAELPRARWRAAR